MKNRILSLFLPLLALGLSLAGLIPAAAQDTRTVKGAATLYIRLRACDLMRGDETGDVTNPENGGGSRLGDSIRIVHTAK